MPLRNNIEKYFQIPFFLKKKKNREYSWNFEDFTIRSHSRRQHRKNIIQHQKTLCTFFFNFLHQVIK